MMGSPGEPAHRPAHRRGHPVHGGVHLGSQGLGHAVWNGEIADSFYNWEKAKKCDGGNHERTKPWNLKIQIISG